MMKKPQFLLLGVLAFYSSFALAQSTQTSGPVLLKLDASGVRGSDSRNGSGGSSSGSNGQNASHPEQGADAGVIDIQVSAQMHEEKFKGVMIVTGQVSNDPSAKQGRAENSKVEFGKSGYIFLDGHGGDGGHGGNGGSGATGYSGSNGSDATRYSSGGNGGNGGPGGDGGYGSSGADAGQGGKITIRANKNESGLLMLFKTDIAGGKGGDAGRHGSGGSGGSGGRGGSSYSWTETEYYTVSDTDSNGNSTSRTESRTHYHSNSGGMSGSSGSSGSTPNAPLNPGQNGESGKVSYLIQDGANSTAYDSMYSLKLLDFEFEETFKNGVFEPGEEVIVKKIRVKNIGDMPTPSHQPIRVFISNRDWVLSDGSSFEIPKSLGKGEEYLIEKQFSFRIKSTTIDTNGPRMTVSEQIVPKAEVTQVNRLFEEFDYNQSFQVSYPVEITAIKSVTSLSPGEKSKIFWQIKNISNAPLGLDSESKRRIMNSIKISGGDLDPKSLKFTGSDQAELNVLKGHEKSVALLNPNDSMMVEGQVEISADAKAYRSIELQSALHLDTLDSAPLNRIQNEAVILRVSQTYQASARPGLLLVVNNGTTESELATWNQLAKSLGISLDVWDLTYYGHLKMTEALKESSSLAKTFKNKTVVILNNEFKAADQQTRANARLAKSELIKAAGENGIRFYVVGGDASDEVMRDYLIPSEGFSNKSVAFKEYLSNLEKMDPTALGTYDTLEIGKSFMFGQPSQKQIEKMSKKLAKKLISLNPDQRSVVMFNYNPTLIKKKFFGLIKKWSLGNIEVRTGVNERLGLGIKLGMSDAQIHTPEVITGSENVMSLALSLSPELKLEILQHAVANEEFAQSLVDGGLARGLIEATLIDVAFEQMPYIQNGAGKKEILTAAKLLNGIGKLKSAGSLGGNASHSILNELVAELHVMSSSQMSWYDYLMPWKSKVISSRIIRKTSYDLVYDFYDKGERDSAMSQISEFRSKIKKVLAQRDSKDSKSEVYQKRLMKPFETSGAQFPNNTADKLKIVTRGELSLIAQQDQRQTENIDQFRQLIEAERCSLVLE